MSIPNYNGGSYVLVQTNHTYVAHDDAAWGYVLDFSDALTSDPYFKLGITDETNICVYDVDEDTLCDKKVVKLDLVNNKLHLHWLSDSSDSDDKEFMVCSGPLISESDTTVLDQAGFNHYFTFEEGSGTYADEAGSAVGTPYDVNQGIDGVVGNGVETKDTGTSYVSFGVIPAFNLGTITIEFWIYHYLHATPTTYVVMRKHYSDVNYLDISMGGEAYPYYIMYAANGLVGGSRGIPFSSIPSDEWVHLSFVYDSTLSGYDKIKIYVNGVEASSYYESGTLPPGFTVNSTLYLGSIIYALDMEADEYALRNSSEGQTYNRARYRMLYHPELFYTITYPYSPTVHNVNLIGNSRKNLIFSVVHKNYDLFDLNLKFKKNS